MKINHLASITTITAFCTIVFSALPGYSVSFKNTDPSREATDVHYQIKLAGEIKTVNLVKGQDGFLGVKAGENLILSKVQSDNLVQGSFQFSYPTDPQYLPGTQVPEPLTILGSLTALGFGIVLKIKYSKKVEKQTV